MDAMRFVEMHGWLEDQTTKNERAKKSLGKYLIEINELENLYIHFGIRTTNQTKTNDEIWLGQGPNQFLNDILANASSFLLNKVAFVLI